MPLSDFQYHRVTGTPNKFVFMLLSENKTHGSNSCCDLIHFKTFFVVKLGKIWLKCGKQLKILIFHTNYANLRLTISQRNWNSKEFGA